MEVRHPERCIADTNTLDGDELGIMKEKGVP